ncbi:MAG: hypothetical protein WC389_15990 [Lutibacter sp.]|jgi:hypothetical protein
MKTNVFKKVGNGIVDSIIGLSIVIALIGFCPITPFIWLLIHASAPIWIWLAVTIAMTVFLIYGLAKASAWQDHDEMFD